MHRFAPNSNSPDGYNRYCVECNSRRRKEQYDARHTDENESNAAAIDQYERFKLYYRRGEVLDMFMEDNDSPPSDNPAVAAAWRAQTAVALDRAVEESFQNVTDPSIACSVADTAFGGFRFQCNVSRRPLTKECFSAHDHVLTVNPGTRDVSVSKTTLQSTDKIKFEQMKALIHGIAQDEDNGT